MLGLRNWRIEQGLPESSPAPADSELSHWQDSATPLRIAKFDTDDGHFYRLRMNSDLAVDVLADGRIVTRRSASVPQFTIDHFLADQVIPRALAHAGSFVFHAGAIRNGDGAIVFLGQSGRGKSTLTASFAQAGMALLGDDAMILSWNGDVPHVRPVYPSLRLFPDSLEALMPGTPTAAPVAHYSSKQRIDVEVIGDAGTFPQAVRALFAIAEPSHDRSIAIRPLSATAACMTLVESSFALDPTDLGQARRRLEDASALARLVPAFEISYPRDYARLPEVREAMIAQLQMTSTP